MYLHTLTLKNFRSYPKGEFTFSPKTTVIIGPNAIGKSNLIEAIAMLATGKSFRTGKDTQLIAFDAQAAQIVGVFKDTEDTETIEVRVGASPSGMILKKYLINGVSKRRKSLSEKCAVVLFTPADLDIVSGQPGERRRFLNEVLEQTDMQYQTAMTLYAKALRQRNALLEDVQRIGVRDEERFAYWDDLLIRNGNIISKKREEFIHFINSQEKVLFPFLLTYDKSEMSCERLLQYRKAEIGAGVTLVGPQRDDVFIQTFHHVSQELEDVKYFCSRGQQRLVTLELKKSQISYFKEYLSVPPILLLDDIFSELDGEHIRHVLGMARDYQTIITTTHREFIPDNLLDEYAMIELVK